MAALTPQRLTDMMLLAQQLNTAILETDPVTGAPPPNPEDPTPGEIENVSAMLDEANGRLEIIRATAEDTATTPQEKIASILQTLGAPQ